MIFGLGAYVLWGFIPLYFKAVERVAPPEVLAHRVLWSLLVLAVVMSALARWRELSPRRARWRLVGSLLLSAFLIGVNWLTFIYAVAHQQVLQASLGYFLNPLATVLLGVVFLGERLRPCQKASIALAGTGVVIFAVLVGDLPWIAVSLAASFSLYGLMRKTMVIDGLAGLTGETLALAPFSLGYLLLLHARGVATVPNLSTLALLSLSGPITVVPLLLFIGAARRLRLSTVGILQYITPTLQFSLAVFAFGERFSTAQLVSFAFIWAAVILYALDSIRAVRGQEK